MNLPLQVTYRGMTASDGVDKLIRDRAAKLEQYFDRITSCRVLLEVPHRHQSKGRLFNLRIDIGVPGTEIVVNRTPPSHNENEDVQVAIREGFDIAKRELLEYAGRLREHRRSGVE
jgi:ribosome-associated translation inhibitor RaiA